MNKDETKTLDEGLKDDAPIVVIDHLIIRDKETGEVLVNKRG